MIGAGALATIHLLPASFLQHRPYGRPGRRSRTIIAQTQGGAAPMWCRPSLWFRQRFSRLTERSYG